MARAAPALPLTPAVACGLLPPVLSHNKELGGFIMDNSGLMRVRTMTTMSRRGAMKGAAALGTLALPLTHVMACGLLPPEMFYNDQ